MKTLIKNIDILTMDVNDTRYENGCILIEGDEIVFVGNEKDWQDLLDDCKIVDGRGRVALPGFINTHTHASMVLFRGYANDLPLMEWLSQKIWPMEDKLNEDDAYWLSMLAIAEMLKGGVTTFADMYMFMEETARAVLHSGVRGFLARGLQGFDEKAQDRLNENRSLYDNWHGMGDGRIQVMVGPHSVYTCDPDYLVKTLDLAVELGVGIHIHLSETRQEVDDCIKQYGKSPVMLLNDLGVLDANVLAAHCVHLSEEDIDVLREKNVRVSHCPASNLKLGSGIAPLDLMLEKDIIISLGTDGAASNNNLSVLKEMALAALMMKGVREEPTLIPAPTALKMGTYNGAKALGWERKMGTLSKGYKADIILIDIDAPHLQPKGDWASHIIYSGYTLDVDSVWVNGKKLMENRELLTIDMEQVYWEVGRIHNKIM